MENKKRNMTVNGFLSKASGKAAISAAAFLAKHREWLETNEDVSDLVAPILCKLDAREIFPTPALNEVRSAVFDHLQKQAEAKIKSAVARQTKAKDPKEPKEPREPSVVKPWTATVYNSEGKIQCKINAKGEEEDLCKTFETSAAADRWLDRRLFEGACDWYGEVVNANIKMNDGSPFVSIVLRDDSVGRVLRQPKAPVMKSPPKNAGRLTFGVKCREDRTTFSGG